MPKTISFHNGSNWSRGHNVRDKRFVKEQHHIDKSLSDNNVILADEVVYLVYDVNGIDLAYHVENEDICIYSNNYSNINMNLYDSECSLITTTANNPVKFSQKSTASDLTQFIKQDWTERGYDFFDLQNFSNNIYHNQSNNIETLEE